MLNVEDDRTVQPFLQTRFNERYAAFSPDGRFVAYESDEPGYAAVYLARFPAAPGKWRVSPEHGMQPRWSPDGRELFYRSGDQLMAVAVTTVGELVLGTPRTLFERNWPSSFNYAEYDVAPDGQRFVMLDGDPSPRPTHLNLVQNWSEELKRLVPVN